MQTVGECEDQDIHAPFLAPVKHWYALRQGKDLPSVEAFKNRSYELEDYRMLSRVKTDPLDVFYYEAGKALEKLYGGDLAGKNLEDLYDDFFRKRAYEGYAKVLEEKLPIYEKRGFSTIIGSIGYYKLHLPFGDGSITDVATYIVPTSNLIKRRFDWTRLFDRTPWF